MNYYERHLGDYAKDTVHLSQMEHGAYTLLIDRYYASEKGIPQDLAYRIGKATTKAEKAAVDFVLREFFTLVDGVWIKARIEEELQRARKKINAAQENGKKGGRPKSSENIQQKQSKAKPTGFELGSEKETKTKAHQTPDTRHQNTIHQSPNIYVIESSETHTLVPEPDKSVRLTAGEVCKRVIQLGIPPNTCNPGHPDLAALLSAGAGMDEFESAARVCMEKGKGFPYLLGIVKGQREQAAKLVLHKGPLPNKQEAIEQSNVAATLGWMPPEMREVVDANQ